LPMRTEIVFSFLDFWRRTSKMVFRNERVEGSMEI
jgi:hypothetical protein